MWLEHFAKFVSKNDIEKYVASYGNYIWHVFSWNLLDEKTFLVGDAAKKAYDEIDKGNALYIEWLQDDDCTKNLDRELYTSASLAQMDEVYVVASDFSWTYIKTHEECCGPYFMKL